MTKKPTRQSERVKQEKQPLTRMPQSACLKISATSVFSTNGATKLQILLVYRRRRCTTHILSRTRRQDRALFWEYLSQLKCLMTNRGISCPSLRASTNQKLTIVGTVLPYSSIEDAHSWIVFEEVKHLTVPELLGGSFIDRFVKGFSRLSKKLSCTALLHYRYSF